MDANAQQRARIEKRIDEVTAQARSAQQLAYNASEMRSGGVCRMLAEADDSWREVNRLRIDLWNVGRPASEVRRMAGK